MTDQIEMRQFSPLTATHEVAIRPTRSAAGTYTAGRREFIALVASGVTISAWALFPSTVAPGIYVPLPDPSSSTAAEVDSASEADDRGPVTAYRLINADQVPTEPSSERRSFGAVTSSYASPETRVGQVSMRAKLQALLLLIHARAPYEDLAELQAKVEALLLLPDSALARLFDHPDLKNFGKLLDAVFLGTSDGTGVRAELDRIEVTSIPGPAERVDVIRVDGKPAYVVRSPAARQGVGAVAGPPAPAAPSPEPVTVTVVSHVEEAAAVTAFTAFASVFAPAPEPSFAPAPPAEMMSTFALAPSSEPLPPAPTFAPAFDFAPSPSFEPPAPPSAPATPASSPEPSATTQPSDDVMTSGNKFEPGETVATPSGGGDATATQTAEPSSTPAEQPNSVAPGGGDPTSPSGGDPTSPSGSEGAGGTSESSAGETSP